MLALPPVARLFGLGSCRGRLLRHFGGVCVRFDRLFRARVRESTALVLGAARQCCGGSVVLDPLLWCRFNKMLVEKLLLAAGALNTVIYQVKRELLTFFLELLLRDPPFSLLLVIR